MQKLESKSKHNIQQVECLSFIDFKASVFNTA